MTGHEPGQGPSRPLPDAEDLTGPDVPVRSPAELSAIFRHSMGLAYTPPKPRDPDCPDASTIRQEFGL